MELIELAYEGMKNVYTWVKNAYFGGLTDVFLDARVACIDSDRGIKPYPIQKAVRGRRGMK